MPKFHIHIYKVESMIEKDIEEIDSEKAKLRVLKESKDKIFHIPDCKFIAISFEQESAALCL